MADSLSVTGNTGAQTPSAQNNLQAPGQVGINPSTTSNFQPVINGNQLKSSNGIPLSPQNLSTVSLSNTGSSSDQIIIPAPKHFNWALLLLSIAFLVIAVVLFKITSDSGKKHNQI